LPVLRYIHRLILTLWLGSIFFFAAAVAPALFRTLSGADSGAVVRELIPRIDAGGLLAGPLLIGLAWAVEGRPSGRARVRAVNVVGLRRREVPEPSIHEIERVFRAVHLGDRPRAVALAEVSTEDPWALRFLSSLRGLSVRAE